MDANKCQTSGTASSHPSSITLSAQRTNVPTCSNCSKPSHTHPYCISLRGGMEGKSLEDTWKKRRLNKEAVRGKTKAGDSGVSQKIQILYKDANGQALILEVDASAVTATLLPNPSPSLFAGIASIGADAITDIASIGGSSMSMESLELEGWMATYDIKDLPKMALLLRQVEQAFTLKDQVGERSNCQADVSSKDLLLTRYNVTTLKSS